MTNRTAIAALALGLAFLGTFPATSRADTISFGQFGSVSWTLNAGGNIASFTFSANPGFLLIDSSVADVNVNTTAGNWSIGNFAFTQLAGFNLQQGIASGGSGNVGSLGTFNQTTNATDGFGQAMSTLSFDITRTTGTWANAAAVLIANALSNEVGAHFAICNVNPCTLAGGAGFTGFIGQGGQVPLPPAIVLFGTALAGMGLLGRRRKKQLAA